MEPMLPSHGKHSLAELTTEIFRKAGALSTQIPSAIVRGRIARLVREMNSYYSNLIEGHKTLPRDIEKALTADFSNDPIKRANQILNRAHIEVEAEMIERLAQQPDLCIHSPDFIMGLHRAFYERLPKEMHWSQSQSGQKYQIEAGKFRTFEVVVGTHQPPRHDSLPHMLKRFTEVYSDRTMLATDRLTALASAHHRLAWIHPFGDGNGRVIRLYSHACIVRAKVDGFGLWTLSRGLARRRQEYYGALSGADQKRWNDLDGRGRLSDRGLGDFCEFFLQTMLDQIDFMNELFQFDTLSHRIEAHLHFNLVKLSAKDRDRLSRLLKAALLEGEIERGRVSEIVGVSETVARELTGLALKEELVESATPKGPLSLVFSSKTLEHYFPKLYQDLPA